VAGIEERERWVQIGCGSRERWVDLYRVLYALMRILDFILNVIRMHQ
jgi:hypothetical protein